MRKEALTVTAGTLVLGIFGAFLRWLQNVNIFDGDGLPVPGAGVSRVYVIYTLLAAAAMAYTALLWLRNYRTAKDGERVFRASTVLPELIAWAMAAVTAAAGVALMFTAGQSGFPVLQRFLGAVTVVAGAALPALPCRRPIPGGGVLARQWAGCAVIVYSCFRIIFCYWSNVQNPVLWRYAPEILALGADVLAFYAVASFFFRRGKPRRALFSLQLAAFLDICTLPDSRPFPFTLLFFSTAAVLLTLQYLLIENLASPAAVPASPSERPDPGSRL